MAWRGLRDLRRPRPLAHRRGRSLLDAAVAELAAAGRRQVRLWTLTGNDDARLFYERQGWTYDGTERPRDAPGAGRLTRSARSATSAPTLPAAENTRCPRATPSGSRPST